MFLKLALNFKKCRNSFLFKHRIKIKNVVEFFILYFIIESFKKLCSLKIKISKIKIHWIRSTACFTKKKKTVIYKVKKKIRFKVK